MQTPPRYYAYGDAIGRMRIPATTEEEAITWASGRGAANVVREEGPASKPVSVTFVWKRDADPFRTSLNSRLWDVLSAHFPNATVREVGKAIADIENAIKE